MKKIQLLPGQESFAIETAPQQREPFYAVPYLSENEGFIELEDLPGFDLDWEREVSLIGLMGEIGVALSDESPRSEVSDKGLAAYEKDFQNVALSVLEPSLYPPRAKAWHLTDALIVSWAEPTYSAPGVIGQDEAVVVTGKEFKTFSKNAELVGKHASAHTGTSIEDAKAKGEDIDDETARNTQGRAFVHAMEVRMKMLADMDAVFKVEQIGIGTLQELAIYGKDAPKLPLGEMDFYRRVSMFAMLQMARVACAQLNYGTNEREGATRALTSAFTRWKRPERRAEAIQAYAKATSNYINAKRGKVSQAASDCKIQYDKNKHFLATKNPSANIT